MQQTLLSLLALLIITMLSFSQQHASMRSQQQQIQEEYQQMALGVAQQVMGTIQTKEFEGGNPKDNCLNGWDALGNCSKIWNFHTDETSTMEAPDNSSDNIIDARTPDTSFPFQVEVEVHHATVDGDGNVNRTSGNSDYKEVNVRVQDCQDADPSDGVPCDGESLMDQPIVLTEVVGDTG